MYQFNLLSDEVSDDDYFEDKTHENVAETLFNLIDSNDRGFTIGLEGEWGSGKSTVISILKKKLEGKAFHYFYFDAWAHEGDHLRRIFLESLLDQLGMKSRKIDELKAKISNRTRKTFTHTNQYGTTLGKLMAFSVMAVPLGAGLVSGVDSSQLSFQWGGNPHWPFWIGVILSIMPFFVVVANIGYLAARKEDGMKSLFNANNWVFLERKDDVTATQEISSEEERSSIEFERYFGDIMDELFKDNPSSKLVIVVDNLDRIEAKDSLKIWSTLQTFLQKRNPSNSGCQWYENIWIIVPHDKNGLSKLWENKEHLDEDNYGECGKNSNGFSSSACAKSFFDKCFQIRLEVPKPVLTGWEGFARKMIDQAFVNWNEEDKITVFRILQLTRKHVGDAPTPREIKNYVNQVGLLRLHVFKEIPVESIAYYVIHKYLYNTDTEKIKENLKDGQLPEETDRHFLPSECDKHLAGIVFGVSPEIGQQLLLEPEIEKDLQDGNGEQLKDLMRMHGDGFWSVFDLHISRLSTHFDLFKYSKAIYEELWEDYGYKCTQFVQKAQKSFLVDPSTLPINENIDGYLPIIKMSSDKDFLESVWNNALADLGEKIRTRDGFDYESNVRGVEKIAESMGNTSFQGMTLHDIDSKNWIKWAQASNLQQIPAYKWVLPPQDIVDSIAENIPPSPSIVPGTKELFIYSINSGIRKWEMLPQACQNHIFWNNGTASNGNQPSREALDILIWLTFYCESCRDKIAELLKTGQFHNFVYHHQDQTLDIDSAFIMAYYFKNKLHDIKVPPLANSINGFQLMRDVWLTRNKENAKGMFENLKKFNQLDILWELAENPENKLVADILELAVDNEIADLFSCSESLNKLHFVMALIGDDSSGINAKLLDEFMKHSEIGNEIKSSSTLDVSNYSDELLLILKKTTDKEILDTLASALVRLEKEGWDTCFAEDTSLADLALMMKAKKSSFSLGNAFLNSIFEIAEQWAMDDIHLNAQQKERWHKFVDLLGDSFQKRYKDKITKLILDEHFSVTDEFYEYNKQFVEYKKLVTDGRSDIQDLVEESLKEDGDFISLGFLDTVLENDVNRDFLPASHIPDVLSDPFHELYWAQKDVEKQDLLKRIAKKFKVEIEEQTPESDDDTDDSTVEDSIGEE
ncbi:hypothetical protein J2755_001522 [Methanohalophilus levihalophilus]|uniref:P-loop NTPase fold protein n=1 Tax=Methanohalophilus levihalophilus TaxID=1431282 RepID=UPI001AE8439A|nr:P-loop NTPase fold protein [Methanohalophilus levihalophilus]MBP2030574.1 hypothetical protein [Methanohalophilus levihalophilus]